jgi:hypothetical protein
MVLPKHDAAAISYHFNSFTFAKHRSLHKEDKYIFSYFLFSVPCPFAIHLCYLADRCKQSNSDFIERQRWPIRCSLQGFGEKL